jgi:uncharacterized membrane protein YcfT
MAITGFTQGNDASCTEKTEAAGLIPNKIKPRLDWVDCAKGLCIIMVVMLHSTLEVAEDVGRDGIIHYLVVFAKPFRMPDFFMISGLFLARVIARDWRTYLDRKVLHFAYFYVLWVTIHFAVKSPGSVSDHGTVETAYLYLETFIKPLGTLWFIYMLPIFFVVSKLVRRVPSILVFTVAAVLEIATIETGWVIIDQFAERFIYFYTGYWLAARIFTFAAWVQANPQLALSGLMIWGVINGIVVYEGYAGETFISLLLGFAGAAAVITIAALLSNLSFSKPIRYCGKNSIVIYLAFFLPMHFLRLILVNTGIVPQVSFMALIATAAGILGSLMLWWLVRNTRLSFLFVRPPLFSLDRSRLTMPSTREELRMQ